MTPLVDFAPESLLCHVGHVTSLPNWFVNGRRSFRVGEIAAFDVTCGSPAVARLRLLATDDLPRFMDHFYLWTPRSEAADRQLLLDALFEVAARDFDHIIHPDQNRENIYRLLQIITTHFGDDRDVRILDFGCGTGLSVEVAPKLGVELVGYDRCKNMRAAAAARGMEVLTLEQFATLSDPAFDAAFASYVFHLGLPLADLQRLWALVRPGGVIAANFHKDHAVAPVTACLNGLGAETKRIENVQSRFSHGSYRLYVRR